MTEIRRILLADDGSEPAGNARRYAVDLAADHHAKLSIVYVREPLLTDAEAHAVIGDAMALAQERDVSPDVMVVAPVGLTTPGKRIVQAAVDCGADLIVVGARGLGGVGRALLGSVSSYVVHHAPCAVLVVR